jgi:hypothetical protein
LVKHCCACTKTGIAWRRSTIPDTICKGRSSASLVALISCMSGLVVSTAKYPNYTYCGALLWMGLASAAKGRLKLSLFNTRPPMDEIGGCLFTCILPGVLGQADSV